MLVPTRALSGHGNTTTSPDRDARKGKEHSANSAMDDLVNHLAALESKETP